MHSIRLSNNFVYYSGLSIQSPRIFLPTTHQTRSFERGTCWYNRWLWLKTLDIRSKSENWETDCTKSEEPSCQDVRGRWIERERERSFQDVLQCQQTKQLPDIYHYPNKNDRIIQSAFETSQTVIFAIQFLIHFLREKSSKSSNRKNKSKVSELKAEQQQLDGLCLALRRAVHAEGLIMEVWAPKGAHWGWIFGWALGEKTSICCTM